MSIFLETEQKRWLAHFIERLGLDHIGAFYDPTSNESISVSTLTVSESDSNSTSESSASSLRLVGLVLVLHDAARVGSLSL
jgi:hypothetical protein